MPRNRLISGTNALYVAPLPRWDPPNRWSRIETVPEDLVPLLARFHRDVLLPDVKQVLAEAVEASEHRLHDEMRAGFESLTREFRSLKGRLER